MTSGDITLSAAAPWLSEQAQALAGRILASFALAYGRPLLAGLASDASPRQRAQELFSGSTVVLAHAGHGPGTSPLDHDPRLIYANRAALRLWRRPWAEMVGMPSRLTAEPCERQARSVALAEAERQRAISGYNGIRIDSTGRRFRIEAARLWSLPPGPDGTGGQAAAFDRWWWL